MTLWQALILGLVEGITEYLPISSTGHLVLASALLGLGDAGTPKQAIDGFNIVIQGGAILAVLGLYRARVIRMIAGLVGRDAAGRKLFFNIVVAFVPAAILGPLLNDTIAARLFHPVPVIAALALGGACMIALGPWQRRFFHDAAGDRGAEHAYLDIERLSWRLAFVIGLFQCLAMWPGMSRSMVTIVAGMLVGMRARHAAEFSFLLGLPTLGGACAFRLAKSMASGEQGIVDAIGWLPLVVGLATATVSAALAIRWLVAWLNRHGLAVFGWYRIALAVVFAVLVLAGVIGDLQ